MKKRGNWWGKRCGAPPPLGLAGAAAALTAALAKEAASTSLVVGLLFPHTHTQWQRRGPRWSSGLASSATFRCPPACRAPPAPPAGSEAASRMRTRVSLMARAAMLSRGARHRWARGRTCSRCRRCRRPTTARCAARRAAATPSSASSSSYSWRRCRHMCRTRRRSSRPWCASGCSRSTRRRRRRSFA
jgi:hypothetical protein